MMDAFRSTRPALRFNLTVKGGRSMTAEVMLPILLQELAAHHYDLVLWQTGTVEAVQGCVPTCWGACCRMVRAQWKRPMPILC